MRFGLLELSPRAHLFPHGLRAGARLTFIHPAAHLNRLTREGNEHFKADRFEEALASHTEALKISRHYTVHFNIAQALYHLRRYQASLPHWREYLAKSPPDEPLRFQAWTNAADSLLHLDYPEAAFEMFKEALRLKPNDATTLHNMGRAYRALNDLTTAIAYGVRAMLANPWDGTFAFSLAESYALDGQLEKAWPLFEGRYRMDGKNYIKCLAVYPVYFDAPELEPAPMCIHLAA